MVAAKKGRARSRGRRTLVEAKKRNGEPPIVDATSRTGRVSDGEVTEDVSPSAQERNPRNEAKREKVELGGTKTMNEGGGGGGGGGAVSRRQDGERGDGGREMVWAGLVVVEQFDRSVDYWGST
jgi:hypothetical protein